MRDDSKPKLALFVLVEAVFLACLTALVRRGGGKWSEGRVVVAVEGWEGEGDTETADCLAAVAVFVVLWKRLLCSDCCSEVSCISVPSPFVSQPDEFRSIFQASSFMYAIYKLLNLVCSSNFIDDFRNLRQPVRFALHVFVLCLFIRKLNSFILVELNLFALGFK